MPKINSPKAWLLAARPKTLTGAMIPVMLAGSLAFYNDTFKPSLWICCAAFACLMQIAANFINDIYDFLKGTDRKDRLGPERACAQGWITPKGMKIGIFIDVSIACAFGLLAVALSWETLPYHGLEFIVLGAVCVIFAFLYTIGLSYLGLGDILVLVFFGFVPVCGTYYLQALTIDAGALILSVISGIAIDALLVINNYRELISPLHLEGQLITSAAPYVRKATSGKNGRKGVQIDYLVQLPRCVYVVEIKRWRTKIGQKVIDEMREKCRRLKRPSDISLRTALVYAGDLTRSVEADGYFDAVVPVSDLLGL